MQPAFLDETKDLVELGLVRLILHRALIVALLYCSRQVAFSFPSEIDSKADTARPGCGSSARQAHAGSSRLAIRLQLLASAVRVLRLLVSVGYLHRSPGPADRRFARKRRFHRAARTCEPAQS